MYIIFELISKVLPGVLKFSSAFASCLRRMTPACPVEMRKKSDDIGMMQEKDILIHCRMKRATLKINN